MIASAAAASTALQASRLVVYDRRGRNAMPAPESIMRRSAFSFVVPVLLLANLSVADDAAAPPPVAPADAGAESGPSALVLQIDKSKVDLKGHKLEATANRELSRIDLKVIGESGAVLAQQEVSLTGRPAGAVLELTWTPSSEETVARIELIAHDTQGNWVGVAVIPWSVSVPHQDVTFNTGSADILDTEKAKLEASYTKISEILAAHQDLGTITLFIAGHTDTVGRNQDNLRLSLRRAEAIAGWFRKRGLTLPIAYEGFGESSLLVKTGDNVNEPRNRRVDYILALDVPNIPATGFNPSWKRMN